MRLPNEFRLPSSLLGGQPGSLSESLVGELRPAQSKGVASPEAKQRCADVVWLGWPSRISVLFIVSCLDFLDTL